MVLGVSSDEALVLLNSASRSAGALLSESHPLLGELADARARAHAARGQSTVLTLTL